MLLLGCTLAMCEVKEVCKQQSIREGWGPLRQRCKVTVLSANDAGSQCFLHPTCKCLRVA